MTLDTLLDDSPGLLGALLMSKQGDVIDVSQTQRERMTQLASFAIGIFELAERMAQDGGIGQTSEMLVQCADGNMFIHEASGDHLLVTLSQRTFPAGAIQHDLSAYITQLTTNALTARRIA